MGNSHTMPLIFLMGTATAHYSKCTKWLDAVTGKKVDRTQPAYCCEQTRGMVDKVRINPTAFYWNKSPCEEIEYAPDCVHPADKSKCEISYLNQHTYVCDLTV